MARKKWRNWSHSVRSRPRTILQPATIQEVQELMKNLSSTGRQVRIVGSGHSFTPLVHTEDVLINIDKLKGIESIDAEKGTVTVFGGTKLYRLGKALFKFGLSQENLGDINRQSVAGLIATGTHGSGIGFGNLSSQVVGLTIVLASGELTECSAEVNGDIFQAARLSLGLLGAVVKIVLKVVPARKLTMVNQREQLDECLKNLEMYNRTNDRVSIYWIPHTNTVQRKIINLAEDGEFTRGCSCFGFSLSSTFEKVLMENIIYSGFCEMARLFPGFCKPMNRMVARSISKVRDTGHLHKILITPRLFRWQEMEYCIPAALLPSVISEIRECMDQFGFNVTMPIEIRFVRADDIWLSPSYERESAYIALHSYKDMPFQEYFRQLENVFRRYDGRPHWGKLHTQKSEDLAQSYPKWLDFCRVRERLDPQGMLLNDYLKEIFSGSLKNSTVDETSSNDGCK